MKKIIKLAENYLVGTRILTLEGDYYKCGVGYELAKAIEYRRKLEQTPITEDWLKEHGWLQNATDLYGRHHWYYPCKNGKKISIIFDVKANRWFITDWWHLVNTLAELYDAMELCGITIN